MVATFDNIAIRMDCGVKRPAGNEFLQADHGFLARPHLGNRLGLAPQG